MSTSCHSMSRHHEERISRLVVFDVVLKVSNKSAVKTKLLWCAIDRRQATRSRRINHLPEPDRAESVIELLMSGMRLRVLHNRRGVAGTSA